MNKYYPSNRPKYAVSQRKGIRPQVPNIFRRDYSRGMTGNRIHASYVERRAVYRDANGNQVMLEEKETLFNTPNHVGRVEFKDPNDRRFKKR